MKNRQTLLDVINTPNNEEENVPEGTSCETSDINVETLTSEDEIENENVEETKRRRKKQLTRKRGIIIKTIIKG